MVTLSWEQVNSWRLGRHFLVERAPRERLLEVVTRIGGLHAQMMSAAELALWARVDGVTASDLPDALWQERTLVKTWAMRGTLHLLAARDFPLYAAALGLLAHFRRGSWLRYHGVTLAELDAIIEAVRATLSETGITRDQLAEAIATQTGAPRLRELLRSGWGALLKPAAFQGLLCFGPNQGQHVTFVRPDRWLGELPTLDPDAAMLEVARRYLAAYGPATSDDFARWLGIEPPAAKRLFGDFGTELAEVEVEGWRGWALAGTVGAMGDAAPSDEVRLLPGFDPYTVALLRQPGVLAENHKGRVSRPQGWISPVVLLGGRMVGVWEHDLQRARLTVRTELFAAPSPELRAGIEGEAERLSDFLAAPAELTIGTIKE